MNKFKEIIAKIGKDKKQTKHKKEMAEKLMNQKQEKSNELNEEYDQTIIELKKLEQEKQDYEKYATEHLNFEVIMDILVYGPLSAVAAIFQSLIAFQLFKQGSIGASFSFLFAASSITLIGYCMPKLINTYDKATIGSRLKKKFKSREDLEDQIKKLKVKKANLFQEIIEVNMIIKMIEKDIVDLDYKLDTLHKKEVYINEETYKAYQKVTENYTKFNQEIDDEYTKMDIENNLESINKKLVRQKEN